MVAERLGSELAAEVARAGLGLGDREVERLTKRAVGKTTFADLIGDSPIMNMVKRMGERAAKSGIPVLITGESGTGKELLARLLHEQSGRCGANFVPINCAAIPRDLLESELFGHRKGAFTGAVADRVGRFEMAHGGSTALLFSARRGDVESARLLLDAGANINDASAAGESALVIAAHSGQGAMARLLLSRGADPNAAAAGYTALHAATLRGDTETVRALLDKQANANAPVTHGSPVRRLSADYSIQKLLEKELIVIAGRNEDMVGKPLIYTTSKNFMDYMGINSPAQLPQLKDITDVQIVMPTSAEEAIPEDAAGLAVNEEGELRQAS